MAAGLQVVATDVGGNPELVDNGETGILVKPNDPQQLAEAIYRLIEDQEIARNMGEADLEALRKKFSVGKMVGETSELYQSFQH